MSKIQRILHLAILTALLTSCAGSTAGLWGVQSTPTPLIQPSATPSLTPPPSPSPTASLTPLAVLPDPETLTPEPSATESAPTLTAEPSGIPEQVSPTPLTPTATLPPINTAGPMDVYQSQGGDTLNIVARRFNLKPEQIIAGVVLPPPDELIPPNTLLLVPKAPTGVKTSPQERTIPDSEIVYGPSTIGFNTADYVNSQAGYLRSYREYVLSGGWISGDGAVERLALENSLNPRMLLALIEYQSHWVLGQPTNLAESEYPLGYVDIGYQGLFRQLMWATGALSDGYYRWRSGDMKELIFKDGSRLKLNPFLNAGTAAIQYYFSQTLSRANWEQAVAQDGFPALYARMFGPTWDRAQYFEPTLPAGLTQPPLTLPIEIGRTWAFISGPHSAWERQGALAALDLAPGAQESGCVTNDAWVLAPAAGEVVRTAPGVVMLDLDEDGYEQTGWVLLFLHIRSDGKAVTGQKLQAGDPIGHASCEGGIATGTHIHIARKYNGEWILAGGPLPFNMDGWIAHNGAAPYQGTLTRDGKTITACTCSSLETNITREK